MDLYCNSLKKYTDCMKSIEEAFLSTLKNIISEIDVCSILHMKENECVETESKH